VAAQAVAGVLIKNVALPLIGARLRNRVDVTGRETAVGHVERRQLDSDLLDRVVGERHADCRRIAILIQPETVVLAYSVQGNAVEAGMFAAAVDGEAVVLVVEVDAGIDAVYIDDVAVEGDRSLHVEAVKRRGGSGGHVDSLDGGTDYDNFLDPFVRHFDGEAVDVTKCNGWHLHRF